MTGVQTCALPILLNAVVTRFAIPTTEKSPPPLAKADSSHTPKADGNESLSLTQSHTLNTQTLIERLELTGLTPDGKKVWKMPNLKGATLAEAMDSLAGSPLKLRAQGNGTVFEQSPSPGEKVRESDLIHLKLSF